MDERTDPALVGEVLAGQSEAFAPLIRRYQEYSYATAAAILSDLELARDVVQEAFLCAFRDLHKLRDPARFPGWLRGIVRNTAFHALRRLQRERAVSDLGGPLPEPVASSLRPDEVAEQAEARGLVGQALNRLTEKDREAVSLFYVNGFSYAQMARFLGVAETTVQGRLQRGRAKLRKELTMVAKTFREAAPDETFARRVTRAVEVYTAKGPSGDHIGSQWDRRLRALTTEILRSGEEGFQIDAALSRSERARLRREAALHFGLRGMRGDARSLDHVRRLMGDSNAAVRRQALRWHGGLIHPDREERAGGSRGRASSVPDGLRSVTASLDDVNVKNRLLAVCVVADYAHLGDSEIEEALRRALADPKHKVHHAVARALGIPCPGCGAAPVPSQ